MALAFVWEKKKRVERSDAGVDAAAVTRERRGTRWPLAAVSTPGTRTPLFLIALMKTYAARVCVITRRPLFDARSHRDDIVQTRSTLVDNLRACLCFPRSLFGRLKGRGGVSLIGRVLREIRAARSSRASPLFSYRLGADDIDCFGNGLFRFSLPFRRGARQNLELADPFDAAS